MKTQITFSSGQSNFGTLIPFFICFLFSLNSHSQKIQTTLTDVWKNDSWENSQKTLNTYDGNGYLTHDLAQSLDVTWKDLLQTDYTNNPDGTVQQSISQLWNTTSNTWEKAVKTTHTYNAAKKVLTTESAIWSDPDWIPSSRDTYTYVADTLLIKTVTEHYDFITPWQNASQITNIYNSDIKLWQSTSWTWADINGDGKYDWENTDLITYTYENSKTKTELHQKWNVGIWENVSLNTNEYDPNGHLSNSVSQKWIAGDWKNDSKAYFVYNADSTLFQIVSQSWDDILQWKNAFRITINTTALGVDEAVFEKSFAFYPNPAQDKISIKTDLNNLGAKYLITDQLGRQFSNGTITGQETLIDVDHFSSGIYFIKIGQNKNTTFKLIKK
jgi:hypothetical protein